jgi:hypothetical protein
MCFLIRFTTNLHEKPMPFAITRGRSNNRITIRYQTENERSLTKNPVLFGKGYSLTANLLI